MNPLVSIIIPTHNRADMLAEAVASCIAQSYRAVEIIVVDDGSTDNTSEVVESFGPSIKPIRQKNSGAPAARNLGLNAAGGEYIKFLDSDDLLMPDAIGHQIQRFLQNPDQRQVAITGNHALVDEAGQVQREIRPGWSVRRRGHFTIADVIARNPPTSSPLYRRDHLAEIGGFTEGIPILQDYDIAYRFSLSGGRYVYHPEVIYSMRQHDSGTRVSMQISEAKVQFQISLIRKQYQELKCGNFVPNFRELDVAISNRAAGILRRLNRWGRQREALELIDFIDLNTKVRSLQYIVARMYCLRALTRTDRTHRKRRRISWWSKTGR
ncbi:glycosyltransferase family 2 protein [Sulfitobacter sp. 1A12126]|uniref:glycosyltransferase family 2 protein n=1 Tax=Sulfitobacter sp. 1A12126 TaxID=3368591 RepID=UPI0037475999